MCKAINYSKYQKRVIKFLNDFLGADTPFTYERTQNNHLKVLIKSVESPLFTGSTPSDCKSINNFMAEVKRAVRIQPELSLIQQQRSASSISIDVASSKDRLIKGCIKSLRARISTMKTQEEELVLMHNDPEQVRKYRADTVKRAVSLALNTRKDVPYLKNSELKSLEQTVQEHVDFMLPTVSYYADLCAKKDNFKFENANNDDTHNVLPKVADEIQISKTVQASEEQNVEVKQSTKSANKDSHNSAQKLLSMQQASRVHQLQQLSRTDALQLIEDINQAIAINRENDIESVIAMIKEKDLPLESIISRLDAA